MTPPPRPRIPGSAAADRADRAHHVQLERAPPTARPSPPRAAAVGAADVVHEAVDAAEPLLRPRGRSAPARRAWARSAATWMPRRRRALRSAPADDRAPSAREQPRGLEADAAGRARDDADLVPQAEVHRAGTLVPQ